MLIYCWLLNYRWLLKLNLLLKNPFSNQKQFRPRYTGFHLFELEISNIELNLPLVHQSETYLTIKPVQ